MEGEVCVGDDVLHKKIIIFFYRENIICIYFFDFGRPKIWKFKLLLIILLKKISL